jgi:cytolethal distending toxin subunit B
MVIVTWNMQGSSAATEVKWQAGVANFFGNGVDVACLQECGQYPPSASLQFGYGNLNFVGAAANAANGPNAAGVLHGFSVSYYTWGTPRTLKHILWMKTDPNSNRVNLAIVSRIAPTAFLGAAPGLNNGRPAIGMRITDPNTNATWDVFTLHAWSGGGNDAAGLLTNINTLAGVKWAALGDFNRIPGNLQAPNGTTKCTVDGPTRPASNAILDYMVITGNAAYTGQRQQLLNQSDHYAVIYDI